MRLAGVRIWQVLLIVYVLCSILSAIGGVLYVGVINAADLQLVSRTCCRRWRPW